MTDEISNKQVQAEVEETCRVVGKRAGNFE